MNIVACQQTYPNCRLTAACLGYLGQSYNPCNQSSLTAHISHSFVIAHNTSAESSQQIFTFHQPSLYTASQMAIIPQKAVGLGKMEPLKKAD